MGYHQAGFTVIGIDKAEQPLYPFRFYRGDVLDLYEPLMERYDVAAVHASPPCQRYVAMSTKRDTHPDMVDLIRDLLDDLTIPWIIENVRLAPLRHPTLLCGSMFGLGVEAFDTWYQLQRHRYFESNIPLYGAGPCRHTRPVVGVYGSPGGTNRRRKEKYVKVDGWRTAMQIDWLNESSLSQALPPAYTKHLGDQLIAHLTHKRDHPSDRHSDQTDTLRSRSEGSVPTVTAGQ